MIENHTSPNQLPPDSLRPFGELVTRDDVVYHGIGADIMALSGIAEHGLIPVARQSELMGVSNSNTTREFAFNSDMLISVVAPPAGGAPNDAFFTYIDKSPVSFAINSDVGITQLTHRGFLDEAFIQSASTEDIVGIVVDGQAMDVSIADMPIVSGNVSADVVAEKAAAYFDFLVTKLDPSLAGDRAELEGMLRGLEHLTPKMMQAAMGLIGQEDEAKVQAIDDWLRGKLEIAMQSSFGRSLTVLELVKMVFQDKPIFVNNHDAVTKKDEHDYLSTLDPGVKIGFEKFDGLPNMPSAYYLRRAFKSLKDRH